MDYTRLQYISQGLTAQEQLDNIKNVLDAGCKWIQLRFKNAENNERIHLAEQVKMLCSDYQSIFIMNDHVDIAKMVDADGVHLGLLDAGIKQARSILGINKIIGGTTNTIKDVQMRINEKCNYIGLGPFRFTSTKEKLSPVLGMLSIANIMQEIQTSQNSIPVYAIGGITFEDIAPIMKTGVYGIAVSGDITQHLNKKELIQNINLLLYEQLENCR